MTEQELLSKMVAPGQPRETKWRQGVIQILVTSSCDLGCYNCTQASNLSRKHWVMMPDQFEAAVKSLAGYFGVFGVFGGNPPVSKYFNEYCEILQALVPFEQRGLWSNNPLGKGKIMRRTFNPGVSNLNVHLSQAAYDEFKRDWPECMPCGLNKDSRHSPPWVAMKDVIDDEDKIRDMISTCDVNRFWSAMIGVFRGQLRAWFCEIAGAQAILHQDELDYPDTGAKILDWGATEILDWEGLRGQGILSTIPKKWWELPMNEYRWQVRKHCFDCGVPLRGYGELAQGNGKEQVSESHAHLFKPKRKGRQVEVVTELIQLEIGKIEKVNAYLQNAKV